jgi:hypothetical protein
MSVCCACQVVRITILFSDPDFLCVVPCITEFGSHGARAAADELSVLEYNLKKKLVTEVAEIIEKILFNTEGSFVLVGVLSFDP